jgi:hypothetical protein
MRHVRDGVKGDWWFRIRSAVKSEREVLDSCLRQQRIVLFGKVDYTFYKMILSGRVLGLDCTGFPTVIEPNLGYPLKYIFVYNRASACQSPAKKIARCKN